jgi:hypothetical protein
MKKLAISLTALAAISTAALASGNRNYDLRDSDTYTGPFAQSGTFSMSAVDAFAYTKAGFGSGLTLQELIYRAQDERHIDTGYYYLRDDAYNSQASGGVGVNALTVSSNDQILSNFERLKWNQEKNESDSH